MSSTSSPRKTPRSVGSPRGPIEIHRPEESSSSSVAETGRNPPSAILPPRETQRAFLDDHTLAHQLAEELNTSKCFLCDQEPSEANQFVLDQCEHLYCKSCVEQHVRDLVAGRIYPILCPRCTAYDRTTPAAFDLNLVEKCVPQHQFIDYLKAIVTRAGSSSPLTDAPVAAKSIRRPRLLTCSKEGCIGSAFHPEDHSELHKVLLKGDECLTKPVCPLCGRRLL